MAKWNVSSSEFSKYEKICLPADVEVSRTYRVPNLFSIQFYDSAMLHHKTTRTDIDNINTTDSHVSKNS